MRIPVWIARETGASMSKTWCVRVSSYELGLTITDGGGDAHEPQSGDQYTFVRASTGKGAFVTLR
jgi:hypothetical protein